MANRELPIPPAALDALEAAEILRVWATNGAQHVTISSQLWDDAETWGIVLADLAHHIVSMLSEQHDGKNAALLENLKQGFNRELANPENDPIGSISKIDPTNEED